MTTTRRCDSCGQMLELVDDKLTFRSVGDKPLRAATSAEDAHERALVITHIRVARAYAADVFHAAKKAGLTDDEIDPCGHVRMLADDADDLLAAELRVQ